MWEAMSFFSFLSSFLSCSHPLSRTCPAGWSSLLQVRWVSIPARNQNQANMGDRNMKRFNTLTQGTNMTPSKMSMFFLVCWYIAPSSNIQPTKPTQPRFTQQIRPPGKLQESTKLEYGTSINGVYRQTNTQINQSINESMNQ